MERDIDATSVPQGVVHFVVPHHNLSFDVSMKFGQSLMQLAKDDENGKLLLGEYLECSCGGKPFRLIITMNSYTSSSAP